MSAKSLFAFLLLAAAVVWWVAGRDVAPRQPESLTAEQQRQMQKAAGLEKDMQQQLDERMRAAPSEQ